MEIQILEFVSGAQEAEGTTVIIDVFRAFSVACYAYDSGAASIIATGDPSEAFRLKQVYRNSVLAGERNERKIEGFDFGNSPTEILQTDLSGKTFIHTTTAGTSGLVSASKAGEVITGSFVNASAVARYILQQRPERVSLVAMGYRAEIPAEEDLLCAGYIKSVLTGDPYGDIDERIKDLRHSSGRRFFSPANIEFSPPSDFFLCTMRDRFNFVLKGIRRPDGNVFLERSGI